MVSLKWDAGNVDLKFIIMKNTSTGSSREKILTGTGPVRREDKRDLIVPVAA